MRYRDLPPEMTPARRVDEIIHTLRRFVTVPPSARWVGPWRDDRSKRLGRELWHLAVKLDWAVAEEA